MINDQPRTKFGLAKWEPFETIDVAFEPLEQARTLHLPWSVSEILGSVRHFFRRSARHFIKEEYTECA